MELHFVIKNEIVFKTKITMTKEEFYNNNASKFKIPLNKSNTFINKKRYNYDEEDDEDSFEDDSFNEEDEINESLKSEEEVEDISNEKKLLRRYKNESENLMVHEFGNIPNKKKPKRELTEDDILKKNDQILKRKLHAKKLVEEEKRQAIERILNEDGKKLRERQKKINEEAIKKKQQDEEKYLNSLNKIKLKYQKDGKVYLRFPQGLLLPKVLVQKSLNNPIELKCEVSTCQNVKKYRDPKTKVNYCSVECFKKLRSN